MSWYVYLIECADGSLYTGIAIDPQARFDLHACGKGARYTRSHPPLRLLAAVPFPDRSSASKAEYRVKRMAPADKRGFAARGGFEGSP
ncbi:MAG TPA: GIY-YIG nuclease family protein [Usitatibacter sp.]|nr:GIY-YIG nuclease family protein [Usitatibacter sp.]